MIKDPTGLIFIAIGILFLIKPVVVLFIEFKNKLKGIQTNITEMTIWYYRACGILAIVAGCVIFYRVH